MMKKVLIGISILILIALIVFLSIPRTQIVRCTEKSWEIKLVMQKLSAPFKSTHSFHDEIVSVDWETGMDFDGNITTETVYTVRDYLSTGEQIVTYGINNEPYQGDIRSAEDEERILRLENYKVILDNGKQIKIDRTTYDKLKPGNHYHVKYNLLGFSKVVDEYNSEIVDQDSFDF